MAPPSLEGPDLPCGSGPSRLGPTIAVRLTASDEKLGVDHHNTVKLPGNIVQGIIIYTVQWMVSEDHHIYIYMDCPPRTTKYSTLVNGMSPCFLAFFSGRPSLNPGKKFFFFSCKEK